MFYNPKGKNLKELNIVFKLAIYELSFNTNL